MSYVQTYYHIVFSTKNRAPALHQDRRRDLYGYLWGILKNKDCHLYQLGGTEDHIHMLTSIHHGCEPAHTAELTCLELY